MDELIQPSPLSRSTIVGILAASAILVVGTLAVDVARPAPQPTLGAVAKRSAQRRRDAAQLWDGSRFRLVEDDLRARSRVQFALAPLWSALVLRLGRLGNDNVVVGDAPWLFERSRVETPPGFDVDGPELVGAYLASLTRRFLGHGSDLRAALLPRKATVCRSQLPERIAYDPSLDERALEAALVRGARPIQVLDRWLGMPPEDVYRPTDTHWNLGGRTSFAEALRAALPEWAGERPDVPLRTVAQPREGDLLGLLGIRGSAFAAEFSGAPEVFVARADPAELLAAIEGRPGDRILALAGTSFSALPDVQTIVSHALGRIVHVHPLGGGALGESLTALVRLYGVDGLPRCTVYEFPYALAIAAIATDGGARRTMCGTFAALPLRRAAALDPEGFRPEVAPRGEAARARLAPGEVLVSGDGVACLRVDAPGGAPFALRVSMGSFRLWAERAGSAAPVDLPILAGGAFDESIVVDANGGAVDLELSIVTDADLGAARPLLADTSREGQTFGPSDRAPLGRFETLVVRGSLQGPLEIRVVGRNGNGAPLTQGWRFDQAAARIALMSLAAFESGTIDSVVVDAPAARGAVSVAVAPLAGGGAAPK